MTKYREILRLKSLGLSQQSIADGCNVSKKTVNRVLKRAKELNISWPLDKSDTDAVLAEMFFPSTKQVRSNKRMPDYDYVHKELLRNGVSKKLLWTEYMEDCHANGEEPLMYSQFCYDKYLLLSVLVLLYHLYSYKQLPEALPAAPKILQYQTESDTQYESDHSSSSSILPPPSASLHTTSRPA